MSNFRKFGNYLINLDNVFYICASGRDLVFVKSNPHTGNLDDDVGDYINVDCGNEENAKKQLEELEKYISSKEK